MNADILKFLSIASAVLIGGLILKDASQFSTVVSAGSDAVNKTLSTLEAAGSSSG